MKAGYFLFLAFSATACGGGAAPAPPPEPPPPAQESAKADMPEATPAAAAEKPAAAASTAAAPAPPPKVEFPPHASVDQAIQAIPQGAPRLNMSHDLMQAPLLELQRYDKC